MAAATETVWAIDIGSSSLKALHLSTERGGVEVIGFDNIRHGKILTGSGVTEAEREELIALSLRRFVTKHDVSMDDVIVSVPSQNSFARFVNLPPVEAKRVPEIVKFEAVQQIPFDINDVQWDWQLMTDDDSAELKVGIFAIKNEIVNAALEHYNGQDIQVSYVQMAPMALYNYMVHDRPELVNSNSRATVVLNVGAEITDLVVCTQSAVWQRCILIGGNSFTRAIADTFRLDFEKAEKLKRTAPVSKYARQIFQAMRPVFTELASEVQRSLGFYKSSNPNTKISRVIGLGGGTKLRGLLKYLQQSLQMPVERPDAYKRLAIGAGVPAAKFGGNVCDFGVVYGLAVQGLGLGSIESNLLPRSMVRSMAWAGKSRWFLGAACMLLAVSVLALGRTVYDRMSYKGNRVYRQKNNQVLADAKEANENRSDKEMKIEQYKAVIDKEFEIFEYRDMIPQLYEILLSNLPNAKNNPRQADLYDAFIRGDVDKVTTIPRKDREQLFVTNMSIFFTSDLATARFGGRHMWQIRDEFEDEEYFDEDEDARFNQSLERPDQSGLNYYPGGGEYGYGQKEETDSGFVVTIAGYSPYKNIELLIDPPGVEDRPDNWGFVTRLMHLSDTVDGNSPLEVYEKTNPDHFRLRVGNVDAHGGMMPSGIGETSFRYMKVAAQDGGAGPTQRARLILIDPMTKEMISRAIITDENDNPKLVKGQPAYEVNDRWFMLNIKFIWNEDPNSVDTSGAEDGGYSKDSTSGSVGGGSRVSSALQSRSLPAGRKRAGSAIQW